MNAKTKSMGPFSWGAYFGRLILAILIVFGTYNPSEYSYFHWAILDKTTFLDLEITTLDLLKFLVGIMLIIGWTVFIRATMRSLGIIGVVLAASFFLLLFWLVIEWMQLEVFADLIQYLLLTIIGLVLTTGVSWSHIRRRLTGQMDVDDVDEG